MAQDVSQPTPGVIAEQGESHPVVGSRGSGSNFLLRIWQFNRRWPVLPGLVLSLLIATAIFAPLIAPTEPDNTAQRLNFRNHAPTWGSADEHTGARPVDPGPNATTSERSAYNRALGNWHPESWYIIGGDNLGRDLLTRVVFGSRVSLRVAAIGLVSGTVVGTLLGLVAGYYGGWVDEVVGRFVDVWLALPFILLALALAVVWTNAGNAGRQPDWFWNQGFLVLILIALLAWTGFVRQVRADALSVRSRDYVLAAKISGASNVRILYRHVLPGTYSTVLVVASLSVGGLILAESILSFLGVGFPDPVPAWGKSVSDGRAFIEQAWWITVFPGGAIFLTVMSFNFIGDWLRDRLDPRLRQLD